MINMYARSTPQSFSSSLTLPCLYIYMVSTCLSSPPPPARPPTPSRGLGPEREYDSHSRGTLCYTDVRGSRRHDDVIRGDGREETEEIRQAKHIFRKQLWGGRGGGR